MEILLVQPPLGTDLGFASVLRSEPLGLECVGGALRTGGHDVTLTDLRIDSWADLEHALDGPPDLVGVSCSFSTDVHGTLEIARFVKERWPALPVMVGGHHASLLPDDFLQTDSGVEAVVIGEGERTALELVAALEAGTPPSAVPGVRTRANRQAGFEPRTPCASLDLLPRADRSLTARYRRMYHHGLMTRTASIETSRGCPFDCTFCSISALYRRRFIPRSVQSIIDEVLTLRDHDYVFITDDLAFYDGAVYGELADRIIAMRLHKSFSCESRCDLVLRHRALLPRWREAGLDTIFLGVEKVDDAGLAAVRKRTAGGASANVEAIRAIRAEGITPMTSFIVDPDWSEQDFDHLEEFVDRMELPSPSFTILTPLPGTQFFHDRQADLVTRDYAFFDVAHAVVPTRLPLARFYERFARLYGRVIRDVRPSGEMLLRAAKLAWAGDAWCMKKVYRAVQTLRDPRTYLAPPPRVRAPARLYPRAPPWRAALG